VEDDLLQSPHYRERSGTTPRAIILMFLSVLTLATVVVAVRGDRRPPPTPPTARPSAPAVMPADAGVTAEDIDGAPYTLQTIDTPCVARSTQRCPMIVGRPRPAPPYTAETSVHSGPERQHDAAVAKLLGTPVLEADHGHA
jgi:hypothetical protein